jgi:hypothetical protein
VTHAATADVKAKRKSIRCRVHSMRRSEVCFRGQPGRPARAGFDQVRIGDQPQDRCCLLRCMSRVVAITADAYTRSSQVAAGKLQREQVGCDEPPAPSPFWQLRV